MIVQFWFFMRGQERLGQVMPGYGRLCKIGYDRLG